MFRQKPDELVKQKGDKTTKDIHKKNVEREEKKASQAAAESKKKEERKTKRRNLFSRDKEE